MFTSSNARSVTQPRHPPRSRRIDGGKGGGTVGSELRGITCLPFTGRGLRRPTTPNHGRRCRGRRVQCSGGLCSGRDALRLITHDEDSIAFSPAATTPQKARMIPADLPPCSTISISGSNGFGSGFVRGCDCHLAKQIGNRLPQKPSTASNLAAISSPPRHSGSIAETRRPSIPAAAALHGHVPANVPASRARDRSCGRLPRLGAVRHRSRSSLAIASTSPPPLHN
jgi:hypothetical protein